MGPLAKVVLLHLPGNNSAYDALDQPRRFPEQFKTLIRTHEPVRVGDKVLDELTPTDIAQEVLRIVFGLQIPLLSLAMFHTKFTHFRTTSQYAIILPILKATTSEHRVARLRKAITKLEAPDLES